MTVGILLLMLSATSTPMQVEPTQTPCQLMAKTFDLYKFGPRWLQWTEVERFIYLEGVIDGQSLYVREFILRQPEAVRNQLLDKYSLKFDETTIAPVMTSLYRDPANVFINYRAMAFIARDKLLGREVEPLLRKARQEECGGNPKKQ